MHIRFLASIVLVYLSCSKPFSIEDIYKPAVVFTGCFAYGNTGCTPDTLEGNLSHPNKCYMTNDTLRLYFYSADYQEKPWKGTQIRIFVVRTDSNYIVTRDAIFHCANYDLGSTNLSYELAPLDTNTPNVALSMTVEHFSSNNGDSVVMNHVSISPRKLGATTMALVITDGEIRGTMH